MSWSNQSRATRVGPDALFRQSVSTPEAFLDCSRLVVAFFYVRNLCFGPFDVSMFSASHFFSPDKLLIGLLEL